MVEQACIFRGGAIDMSVALFGSCAVSAPDDTHQNETSFCVLAVCYYGRFALQRRPVASIAFRCIPLQVFKVDVGF